MATLKITALKSHQKVTGEIPVTICVSQRKNRAYIQTGIFINDINEFSNGKIVFRKDAKLANESLNCIMKVYNQKLEEIEHIEHFSALQIKNKLIDKDKATGSFVEFWKKRVDEIRKEGRESYASMNEASIKLFLKAEGDINIMSIDKTIVEHFSKWLRKQKFTSGGIGIRLAHLKARINELIEQKAINPDIHPFINTSIPQSEPRELDITINEFIKIRDSKLPGKRLMVAKDMFLLSFYLGGINFKDLLDVNLSEDTLQYERKKTRNLKETDQKIIIPISKEAKEIIDKYIKRGKLNLGYSFTYGNLQRYINRGLHDIQEKLGIKSTLCFYSARKTFAQFASDLGIPDNVIDYCLGHSDKKKGIIRYYTKIKVKQAEIAINRVIDYTNNPDNYKEFIEMRADIMLMKL